MQRQGGQDVWDGGGNEGTIVGPSGGTQGQVGKFQGIDLEKEV